MPCPFSVFHSCGSQLSVGSVFHLLFPLRPAHLPESAKTIRPVSTAFLPTAVDTSGHYDFIRLMFLHAHREASALVNELPEESDQLHFHLSSRPSVPLSRFIVVYYYKR